MEFFKRNFEFMFIFLLAIIIFILKYPILNLPYSWDVMNYVIPSAQHIYEGNFTIFLWSYSNGHPPFYFILLGFLFKLFGNSQIVSNLVTIFFSFLATYYTYLIGKHLFSRKIGVIAAFLMFFYPTFFSHSGISHVAIPLTALAIISIYYFIKNNRILYLIFSSFLVLTEERAVVIPVSLLIYDFFKNKKFNFKRSIILSLPIILFMIWMISNKLHYGYFLWPLSTSLFSVNFIQIFLNIFMIFKNLFFDYYKWILTSFIIISCFSFKLLRNRKKVVYSIIVSVIFFIFIFILPKFSIYFQRYFPNIADYFIIVKYFSFLFAILLFILLLSFNKFIDFWNDKKFYPFYFIFIFIFLSYVLFIPFAPRYALPIYPIIFLFFSVSLVKVFKKYSYIAFVIVLILFATQWFGDRDTVGFTLEYNMEYVDAIKTHQMATNYLEENYPDAVILASFPQSLELQYPYLGYVKKPLKTVSIPPFPGLTSKNFTIHLNSGIYNKTIDLNSIDIVYYSDQEFKTRHSKEINKILNKTLVKKFEMNGKVAEIYEVNKEFEYPNFVLPLD